MRRNSRGRPTIRVYGEVEEGRGKAELISQGSFVDSCRFERGDGREATYEAHHTRLGTVDRR